MKRALIALLLAAAAFSGGCVSYTKTTTDENGNMHFFHVGTDNPTFDLHTK